MLKYKIIKINWAASLLFFILFSLTKNVCAENNMQTQQQQSVQGKVSDAKGIPLPGVNVVVKGTTTGAITDKDGNYSIKISINSTALVFSFIGMKTSEIIINNQTVIDVTLSEDISGLDEVIVTGYMNQKKADLTGSIAVVSKTDIDKSTDANILKSLQGKIPGMVITTDGNPNDNVTVTIRGITSMSSAPPLLVIDGLPSTINLKDFNTQDIESIQVLKDAASASIYGSRAASGVILITTKHGKIGEQQITYDASVGFSHFKPISMLNTQEYGQCLWQAAINDGLDPNQNTQIYSYDWHKAADGTAVLDKVTPREWLNTDQTMKSANTDWMKEATRIGLQMNHQLTISNGTERAKTMLSINYYENQGTQIYTYFKKISARFNSEYNLIKNVLTIGENFTIGHENIVDQNVMRYILTEPPICPVHLVDGTGWGGTAYGLGMDDYDNPVKLLWLGKDNVDHYLKLLGSMYANLKVLKNLNLKTSIGIDYTNRDYNNMQQTWQEGGGKINTINGVTGYASKYYTTTWTNTLNYNLNLGNNQLDFLAGMEAIDYTFKDLYGSRNDILFQNLDYAYLSSATGTQTVAGTGDQYTMLSYFGKFNYAYNSKYLLSATLRYDGSSKFGINNRYGFFPAVSAGWRISEEPFFKEAFPTISSLKVRVGWGMNGNSNIPTSALINYYDANYSTTSYGLLGNDSGTLLSGYRRIHTGNEDLKWETTIQTNIGVDFGLWHERLSGSLDYYNKSTKGMLYQPGYLSAIGEGGAMWLNAADMTNTGVEFQLMYASDPQKDFTYTIGGNIATNKNTIDNLPSAARFDYGGNGLGDDILGRPLNSFYGFVADGIFKTQEEVDNSAEQPGKGIGRIRYKDLNHDGIISTQFDRTWIGVSDPDFSYGISFNAKYKNFDFYMFWQGIWGNTVQNDWKTYSDFWNVWTQNGFNHPTRILGAWTTTNQNSTIPALSMSNPNDERRLSTYFMESGSYLKLRNIELGYTFPKNIASKLSMKNLRIYILAQNFINLKKWWGKDKYTGLDPETPTKSGEYSNPYSVPQILRMGVSVTF
jgi:TonB-linked SusC/RagA family outer membrane protein